MNTVTVVDGLRDAVVASVPVGSEPQRVAVDPSTQIAYVTDSASNTVSVISPAAPPTVTSVSPTSGSTIGGQTVTVTGSGFTAPATVESGTIPDTFRLQSPGSTGCTGTPLSSQAVAMINGSAMVTPVTVTQAGTYRWRAIYGGDSRNLTATGACVPVKVTA